LSLWLCRALGFLAVRQAGGAFEASLRLPAIFDFPAGKRRNKKLPVFAF